MSIITRVFTQLAAPQKNGHPLHINNEIVYNFRQPVFVCIWALPSRIKYVFVLQLTSMLPQKSSTIPGPYLAPPRGSHESNFRTARTSFCVRDLPGLAIILCVELIIVSMKSEIAAHAAAQMSSPYRSQLKATVTHLIRCSFAILCHLN